MVERRYSRIPYFVGLAGLLGAQFFAFQQLESPWLAVLVLQLIKVPLTVWRLNDLARSPDDSLWTVVPVANVALAWICLTTATPSAEKWERLRGRWYGQISAFGAFSEGAKLWTNRRPRRRRGGWIRRHFGLGVLPGCSITGDLPGVGCRAAGRLWAGAVGVVGLAHALHGASVHETEDSESSKLVSIAVSFAFNLTFHHRKRG